MKIDVSKFKVGGVVYRPNWDPVHSTIAKIEPSRDGLSWCLYWEGCGHCNYRRDGKNGHALDIMGYTPPKARGYDKPKQGINKFLKEIA